MLSDSSEQGIYRHITGEAWLVSDRIEEVLIAQSGHLVDEPESGPVGVVCVVMACPLTERRQRHRGQRSHTQILRLVER